MQKLEFVVNKNTKVSKAIIDELPFLSLHNIKTMLQNKDVKLNNVRIKEDLEVNIGDKLCVFYQQKEEKQWYTLIYSDNNVVIVNKRAGIEVVSEKERDLTSILQQTYPSLKAVHRIDRNTEGLVVFALNQTAEQELLTAFKDRKGVIKKYALMVHGRVDIAKIKRTVYLKKVDNLSKVWISEVKTSGYDPIITEFELVQYLGDNTLLQAKLITGKTHQIRAHIAYYGYPILGEHKYGNDDIKQLHLTANYLAFEFKKGDVLAYLNTKNFEIVPTWL